MVYFLSNSVNNNINNLYNSNTDNKIKQLEKNQIKHAVNNEYNIQFDELRFDNSYEPTAVNDINIDDKGKNFFLQRDIEFHNGY